MAKKLTKQQAMDLVEKRAAKVGEAGMKRVDEGLPKMKASAKKLADALKAADSPELIDTQSKHLKLQMRPVAEGVALLDEAIRRVKEFEQDEEMFELIADELADIMKFATDALEKSRKSLLDARKLTEQAATALEGHKSDAKEAEEEWAALMTELERKFAGAKKEAAAWVQYDKDATAAHAARDKGKLAALKKAKPASPMLDEFAALSKPQDAFAAFVKEYDVDTLAEPLKKKIQSERMTVVANVGAAKLLAARKAEIDKRVGGLQIEPRDGRKAIGVLGLPSSVLGKVQAALDGPDAARAKALEAIAKACKVEGSGKELVAKLEKAGIL
jgi:hypothetical protein